MGKRIELLAPAGDFESFKAAINNGADAIYLGFGDFNARSNIENFSSKDVQNIVNYAHLFHVKVYVTINILFNDQEFERIEDFINKAYFAYVDAFIVQDIGLATFLIKKYPNIVLHASTQMGIHNLEGALFAKKVGFKRIVLSRETPLEEIKRIKENCDIEIEYFIQGALCVAFSGNCYLSSLLNGFSGNRGKCKQLCRLPYEFKNKDLCTKGYLLSTKDFCMIPSLKKLYESGVTSFKIEGRARRPGYVAQVVNTYRKIIDNNFSFKEEDLIDIKKVFNRGNFINGYFLDEKIICRESQNHIGIKIGEVTKFIKGKNFNEIIISSTNELNKDDVLKFFDKNKEMLVITVKDLTKLSEREYRITSTNECKKGWQVNLIVDNKKEKSLLDNKKKILVDAIFEAYEGEKAKLTLKSYSSEIVIESDFIIERAKTSALKENDCIEQLSKLGEDFKLNKVICKIGDVFIAKSQLNMIRRNAIESLKSQIVKNYNQQNFLPIVKKNIQLNINNFKKTPKKMVMFENFTNFEKIKDKFDYYIYQPNDFSINLIEKVYSKYREYNVFISFPIMVWLKDLEIIKKIIKICKLWGIYANNYYALTLAKPDKTIIGSTMNVYNSYSVNFYKELGYDNIVLTIEDIDLSQIKNSGVTLFQMIHYYPEYMYLKHCPIKENLNVSCNNCQYNSYYEYKLNSKIFRLIRRKILSCQFVLKSKNLLSRNKYNNFSTCIELGE